MVLRTGPGKILKRSNVTETPATRRRSPIVLLRPRVTGPQFKASRRPGFIGYSRTLFLVSGRPTPRSPEPRFPQPIDSCAGYRTTWGHLATTALGIIWPQPTHLSRIFLPPDGPERSRLLPDRRRFSNIHRGSVVSQTRSFPHV